MNLDNGPIVIRYNDYTFPATTTTQDVQIRPMYDPAGRIVSYVQYEITIKSIVTADQPDQSTDQLLSDLRRRLTEPARPLEYRSVGLGDLRVNLPAQPTKDVLWGPKPQLLRWRPLGQRAAEIVWTVRFAIPECSAAQYAFAPMEFNFRVVFAIDNGGYTRRTYSGHIRIPQTRQGANPRALSDNADKYRDLVVPPIPKGFKRNSQTFTLSADKCQLDFEIVDEEQPSTNYFPPGVVLVSASHEISTDKAFAGTLGDGTITATYEMAKDVDKSQAYLHFLDLVTDRANHILQTPITTMTGKVVRGMFRPVSLRVSEPEIYGRRHATFTLRYTSTFSMQSLISASGLWRAAPRSNWNLWLLSLKDSAHHLRGNAKLAFENTADALIDLCQQNDKDIGAQFSSLNESKQQLVSAPSLDHFRPTPENSWLEYDTRVIVLQKDDTYSLKTLPSAQIQLGTLSSYLSLPSETSEYSLSTAAAVKERGVRPSESAKGLDIRRVGTLEVYPEPTGADRVIQVRHRPDVEAILLGFAARAGYPITPPALRMVGDANAIPANGPGFGFSQYIAANWLGVPIYLCQWRFRYLLDRMPKGQVPVMDDPLKSDV